MYLLNFKQLAVWKNVCSSEFGVYRANGKKKINDSRRQKK